MYSNSSIQIKVCMMAVLSSMLYAVSLLMLTRSNEVRDFQCVHERNPKVCSYFTS